MASRDRYARALDSAGLSLVRCERHQTGAVRLGTGMLTQLRHAVMLPWWTAQLLIATKSFGRSPLIDSPRSNRHGLHAARVEFAFRLAAARLRKLEPLISAADRDALSATGLRCAAPLKFGIVSNDFGFS
jgi:hypothetical protein